METAPFEIEISLLPIRLEIQACRRQASENPFRWVFAPDNNGHHGGGNAEPWRHRQKQSDGCETAPAYRDVFIHRSILLFAENTRQEKA